MRFHDEALESVKNPIIDSTPESTLTRNSGTF